MQKIVHRSIKMHATRVSEIAVGGVFLHGIACHWNLYNIQIHSFFGVSSSIKRTLNRYSLAYFIIFDNFNHNFMLGKCTQSYDTFLFLFTSGIAIRFYFFAHFLFLQSYLRDHFKSRTIAYCPFMYTREFANNNKVTTVQLSFSDRKKYFKFPLKIA